MCVFSKFRKPEKRRKILLSGVCMYGSIDTYDNSEIKFEEELSGPRPSGNRSYTFYTRGFHNYNSFTRLTALVTKTNWIELPLL